VPEYGGDAHVRKTWDAKAQRIDCRTTPTRGIPQPEEEEGIEEGFGG